MKGSWRTWSSSKTRLSPASLPLNLTLATEDAIGWQPCLFVVDSGTLASSEYPVLVVDLKEQRGRQFRTAASELHSIENNLSISNMDFFEFADAAGSDGIFRGF